MVSASVNLGVPAKSTTLSNLIDGFTKAGSGQHVRFSAAKGLHTHAKNAFNKVDFLAFFRNPAALEARAKLRSDAVDHVRSSIDAEFGKGMGARVFSEMAKKGFDASKGVVVDDLYLMRNIASKIKTGEREAAEARYGVGAMSVVISEARERTGVDVSHWTQERMNYVEDRLTEAFLQLGEGATKADFARASDLVMQTEAFIDIALESPRRGYNDTEKLHLHRAMHCYMPPNGECCAASDDLIAKMITSYALRGSSPDKGHLILQTAREIAKEQPLDQQCLEMRNFIGAETAAALNSEGALDGFLRGNAKTPDESGFASYVQVGHQAMGYFNSRCALVIDELRSMPYFEFSTIKLDKFSDEEQETIALATQEGFSKMMGILLGGKDEESIKAAVAKLPQGYCDLLATAHAAANEEMAKRDGVGDEAHAKVARAINLNLIALRVINPALLAGVMTEPALVGKVTTFTKILQSVANDFPLGVKESLHPALEKSFKVELAGWTAAVDKFMELAAKRGGA